MNKLFRTDPTEYALKLVEDGKVGANHLLLCCVKAASHDDLRTLLDRNELSPRFVENYKTYTAQFKGRQVGAIGAFTKFCFDVWAPSIHDVETKLYETHEHITGLCVSATVETQRGDYGDYL